MPHPTRVTAHKLWCIAIALAVASVVAAPSAAQPTSLDIAANSSIALTERADSGAYQRFTITLTSRDGVVSLVADKDGMRVEREIPADEYLALWTDLLQADLRTLTSPSGARAVPDQSRFVVRHHVGLDAGEFTAYGVDSLDDPRYRRIVRAILALGNRHLR